MHLARACGEHRQVVSPSVQPDRVQDSLDRELRRLLAEEARPLAASALARQRGGLERAPGLGAPALELRAVKWGRHGRKLAHLVSDRSAHGGACYRSRRFIRQRGENMSASKWLLFAFLAVACGAAEQAPPAAASAEEIGVIRVRDLGEIRIKFFPDKAPGHVENWKKLAKQGFYDGTTFHRVIPGFMIQGGDPNSKDDNPANDGTGDPGYKIKAEFNDLPHRRGIVSMARGGNPDSAGSQFFIVVKDSNFLDRQYSAFAEVISGMDVADKIAAAPRDARDRPTASVVMEKVTVEPAK